MALFPHRDEIKKVIDQENEENKEKKDFVPKEFNLLEREEAFGRVLTYFVAQNAYRLVVAPHEVKDEEELTPD